MAWIHNNLILPLMERERHKGLGRRLRELGRFERSPREVQLEIQGERIRQILEHAYEATPYYRRLFDEVRFRPSQWQPGDPIAVPLLTRDALRAHEEELRSRRHAMDDLHPAGTGGTTSTPVRLWRDTEALRRKTALQYHLNRLTGFDQGDSMLMIWGAERDLELNPSWRYKFYEERIMRRFSSAAGQVSDEIFLRFLDRLNTHRPKVLYGYGVTLAKFAEFILANSLHPHQPKIIVTTAEAVSEAERDTIERAFGVKTTDHYGSRDVGMIGMECEAHSGVHFHPAGSFIEFEFAGMTQDGPMHKLIVTDLLNYGMPMIRYATGDCVIVDHQPCSCGLWYPKVKKILGRSTDNILLRDGTEVPGITFGTRMATLKEPLQVITQVQIIQRDLESLTVRYAASGQDSAIEQEVRVLRDTFQDIVRVPMTFNFVRVPEILREGSGKLRLCISEVKRERALGPSSQVA